MKVTNISGSEVSFDAGGRNYVVANAATQQVDDSLEAINAVMDLVEKNVLQLSEPPRVATYVGSADIPDYMIIKGNTVTDGDTITLYGSTFEFDVAADGVTAGNIDVNGATDAAAFDNLKTAINGVQAFKDAGLVATDRISDGTDEILILRATGDVRITDITDEASAGTGTYSFTNVANPDPVARRQVVLSHTATATTELVVTGLTSIDEYYMVLRNSSGAVKAYDGAVTIGGGTLYFDASGAVDIAATDVLFIVAWGN